MASRKLAASDSFDATKPIVFSDDFSGDLHKWVLSIDALYQSEERPLSSPLVKIVPAPGMPGKSAVRFEVPGLPGTFRSEVALPSENGLLDRWYGERIDVEQAPASQAAADGEKGFIVMQWHAVMGKARVDRDFPNLAIWTDGEKWVIRRAFGAPADIKRDTKELPTGPQAGKWTDWVIHAKWSAGPDGEIQMWQNGKLVWDVKGPNCYSNLSVDTTPYLKTGIYRPSRKQSTTKEPATIVYVADVKIGRGDATYEAVEPKH